MPLPDIMPNHFEVLESVYSAAICLQAALVNLSCGNTTECETNIHQACDVITQIPNRMGYQDTYAFIHVLFMLRVAYPDPQLSTMLNVNHCTVEQWAEGLEVPNDRQLCKLAELYEALDV